MGSGLGQQLAVCGSKASPDPEAVYHLVMGGAQHRHNSQQQTHRSFQRGWDTLLMIVEGTAILGHMAQGSSTLRQPH